MHTTAAIRALAGQTDRVPRLFVPIVIVAVLSGCSGASSGLYLHNEAASTTIDEVAGKQAGIGALGPTPTARANQQAFLTADLTLVEQRARVYRDAEIVKLVAGNDALIVTATASIDARLAELLPGDPLTATTRLAAVEIATADLNDERRLYRTVLRVDGPSCDRSRTGDTGSGPKGGIDPSDPGLIASVTEAARTSGTTVLPDPGGVDVQPYLASLSTACRALIDALGGRPGGALGQAADAVEALEGARQLAEIAAKSQQKTFDEAAKAYAAALKAQTPPSEAELGKKAEAVKVALDKMIKGNPVAKRIVSKEMVDRIDAVFGQISGATAAATAGGPGPDGTGKPDAGAVLAGSFIPLAGKLEALAKLQSAQPVVPLLLEKQRLENLKDSAARALDRDDEELGLLRERYQLLESEYLALVSARAILANAATLPGGRGMTAENLAKPANADARVDVIRGLQTYLATHVGQRRRLAAIQFELVDLEHRRVIDANEAAFRAQDTLIGTSVGALKDNLAGGFRSEEVSNLLQSIFLAFIAVGVN